MVTFFLSISSSLFAVSPNPDQDPNKKGPSRPEGPRKRQKYRPEKAGKIFFFAVPVIQSPDPGGNNDFKTTQNAFQVDVLFRITHPVSRSFCSTIKDGAGSCQENDFNPEEYGVRPVKPPRPRKT
jgi:hypothetical protein